MKIRLSSQALTARTVVLGIGVVATVGTTVVLNQVSNAIGSTAFYCGQTTDKDGVRVPTTFARTQDGKDLAVIRWVRKIFKDPNLTPQKRCKEVSQRFQKNYDNGTLRYVKPGKLNRSPVVCASVQKDAGCTNKTLLFTLEPGSDPEEVVSQLFDRRALAAGDALNQFGGDRSNKPIVIDLEAYLYFGSSTAK
ncbi:COP23 domain-containing protein [Scytonema sp. NUACC26]|uniref:COP23 domain-containing protein n=1 Tax=Scytonema sp. NUACC26 TaxID=3140176 RepID=UPI0034DC9CA7